MTAVEAQAGRAIIQVMLAPRVTEGLLVRRMLVDGAPIVASNVPLLRHHSATGFDFGDSGGGSSDLALACVQAVLERLDYIGPTQKLWDGSRVYRLAVTLHAPFRERFIEPARGDELRIAWNQALTWVRQTLLAMIRQENITLEGVLAAWRESASNLPVEPPHGELERAALTREMHEELVALAGNAGILTPFLGMIA